MFHKDILRLGQLPITRFLRFAPTFGSVRCRKNLERCTQSWAKIWMGNIDYEVNMEMMKMQKQTRIKIPSVDGYEIPAILHKSNMNSGKRIDRGVVILAHGIFSNKDERGRFIRQAELHLNHGFEVIRFDFRGHGENPIPDKEVTIGGMIIDLHSVLQYAKLMNYERIFVVASSFGASVLLLYLQTHIKIKPDRIVLLNPLLDYRKTFFESILPWAKDLFNNKGFEELRQTGYITLEESFKMRLEMVIEMNVMHPYETIEKLDIPTRVIHGDKDSKLPYSITKEWSSSSKYVDFQTIIGADHAFKPKPDEKKSFDLILDWLYRGE